MRCGTCRLQHRKVYRGPSAFRSLISKCVFQSVTDPCQACEKAGIPTCVKRWGPGKESTIATGREPANNTANVKASPRPVLEPSRQLPSNMDAVISGEEVNLLEYLYSLAKRRPDSAFSQSYDHIYKRLRWNYGLFIQSHLVRFGLLAFSAAMQFYEGLCGNEDRINEYSIRGYQALRKKRYSSFGVEEMFTMLFLSLAEDCRYWKYRLNGNRWNSDLSRTQRRIVVHLRGMQSLLEGSGEGLKVSMAESFGMEVWEIMVNHFGSLIGHADGMDAISMGSFFRQHMAAIPIFHPCSMGVRNIAMGNALSYLVKIVFQEWVDETNSILRSFAEAELEMYLSLCENIPVPLTDRPRETSWQWRDEQYLLLPYYVAKIVLQICKGRVPLFIWARHQVSAAHDLYKWRLMWDDENEAVLFVLVAALVIPPANDLQC